jgi:hypothetical protein
MGWTVRGIKETHIGQSITELPEPDRSVQRSEGSLDVEGGMGKQRTIEPYAW